MKKVIYIVSDIDKALAFEWIVSSINKEKFCLGFILLNSGGSALEDFLIEHKIPFERIEIKGRIDFLRAYRHLMVSLKREKPHIVHCHLRNAELIGIPVAFFMGIKQRILTRHHSTYNHLYHPKGVWVDNLVSRLATDIVAISKNVKTILLDWEHVKKKKVKLIPHGFDLNYFKEVPAAQVVEIKNKYRLNGNFKIIGIIARYTWLKGYAYSIPAIGRLLKENPNILLVIANAKGNDKVAINDLIQEHIPKEQAREIVFESNLPALYKVFDYYVHVPFDVSSEAFGQTYVEALASGTPSVFTLSGIATEFIRDEFNALVVDYKNAEQIEKALRRLIGDNDLCSKLTENGQNSVQRFSLKVYVQKLEDLYSA